MVDKQHGKVNKAKLNWKGFGQVLMDLLIAAHRQQNWNYSIWKVYISTFQHGMISI